MQELGSIDPDADTGANLRVLRRLFVDVDGDVVVLAVVVEGEGSEETADTAADDGDAEWLFGLGFHLVCSILVYLVLWFFDHPRHMVL